MFKYVASFLFITILDCRTKFILLDTFHRLYVKLIVLPFCSIESDPGVKFAPTESSQFVPVRETPRYVPPATIAPAVHQPAPAVHQPAPAVHQPTPPAIEFIPTSPTPQTKKKKKSATPPTGKFKENQTWKN
jgi:hypothetical protein